MCTITKHLFTLRFSVKKKYYFKVTHGVIVSVYDVITSASENVV
jgi:hypothetical protein